MSRATGATLLALTAFFAPATGAHAAGYDCDASALRASVLGATAIEPLIANRGAGVCTPVTKTLAALPTEVPLLSAKAGVAVTSLSGDTPATQQAVAVGGLAGTTVKVLPTLPVTLPPVAVPDSLGAVTVSLPDPLPSLLLGTLGGATSITVDVRPALTGLLPDGRLPALDLATVDVANAYAVAGCASGRADLVGGSQLAGLKVLGQDLPVDATVEQAVTLVNGSVIDLATLDTSKIALPAGLSLTTPVTGPLLDSAVKAALATLPDISIPSAVAQLKLTPNEQSRAGNRLTQRALRVQLSLLGQSLLDAVIGEASVSEESIDCSPAPTPDAAEQILECATRHLVLTDVMRAGNRVRLEGVADKKLAGRTVDIVFAATDTIVARAQVRSDGTFRATAKLPPRSMRDSNEARYRAVLGREESLELKLMRRMAVSSMQASNGKVTITGRLVRPFTRPMSKIVVKRRVSCSKTEKVAEVTPRADGTFTVVVDAPEGQKAAVYRLESKVQRTERNRKSFPTYTLPRGVNLV